MTQPPYGSEPGRPQDTPRSFPTYGRSEPRPQQSDAPQSYGQSSWVPPGGSSFGHHASPPSYGPPSYGQQPPPYGYPSVYGPQPGPYGYGYTGGGGTNGLATAALVCGLSGLFCGVTAPVAVGLGIAALVQIKKRQQEGTGQAVAGLVIGGLITLFGLVLIAAGFASGWSSADDDYGAPAPVSTYSAPATNIDELVVGECFDEGDEEDEAIRQPCSQPHDAEVIARLTLPAGSYPGDKGVQKAGESGCEAEFDTYVGIPWDDSELESDFWWPDRELWNSGDRVIVCAAYGPDYDQLTGSVKGTKR